MFQNLPPNVVLFLLSQAVALLVTGFGLYYKVQAMEKNIKSLEEKTNAEIKELKEDKKVIETKLSEISEYLAVIKSHFELGTLSKLKTHKA